MRDPAQLGQDLALDLVKDPLMIFTILAAIFLAGLFILAFTGLLGGPFLVFKILFWVIFAPFLLIELIAWFIFGKLKKLTEIAKNRAKKEMNTIDAEVI